jgi:membrane protein DedA with SNARE-associated domain
MKFGVAGALALLLPMEAGIPIPLPSDLVMLFVGQQAAAGRIPLWVAVIAFEAIAIAGTAILFAVAAGPASAIIARAGPRIGLTEERVGRVRNLVHRRGTTALAVGRGTPGLRTVTVIGAGSAGIGRKALVPLFAGATVFLQLHLFLGYALGSAASSALEHARTPIIAAAVFIVVAAVFWSRRRRGRASGQALTEACCPACLALNLLSDR